MKRRLAETIRAVRRASTRRSLRVALVSYRSRPRPSARCLLLLTDDVDTLLQAVQQLHASTGGDGPEPVTGGLRDLARLDLRPRAARAVVWVGDAPPRGLERLCEASLLIPLITGVTEREPDEKRIVARLAEVVARHEAAEATSTKAPRLGQSGE